MKTFHLECKTKTEDFLIKIETLINKYNQENIDSLDAKNQIIKLASSNELYQNYIWNKIYAKSDIKTNEILLYIETMVSIYESKNRKVMERTGLSYARYPIWKVATVKIGENTNIAFTDKCVYIFSFNGVMIYPYNKITNIGYEDKYAYFDIKTTSPYPHRFKIQSTYGKNITKSQNIALFLKCLCSQ